MSKPTILFFLFLKPIGGKVSSTPMTKVLLSFFVSDDDDELFDELLPHPATTTMARHAVSSTATSFFFMFPLLYERCSFRKHRIFFKILFIIHFITVKY